MRIRETAQNVTRKILNNAIGASPPTGDGLIRSKCYGWRVQLHKDDDRVRVYIKELHLTPSSGLR
jgi:hypothetical protein